MPVGGGRLLSAAQTIEELSPSGVIKVIAAEPESVDDDECVRRPVPLGDRDRSIERNDGRRR